MDGVAGWAAVKAHRHPRYASLPLRPNRCFANMRCGILRCQKPPVSDLTRLIEMAGGAVVSFDPEEARCDAQQMEKVDYFVVGDKDDVFEWMLKTRDSETPSAARSIRALVATAGRDAPLVTSKVSPSARR
jgi:hypothetical protein